MKTAALLTLLTIALTPSLVSAQANTPSSRAIELFNSICVATDASRRDIVQRLTSDGWEAASYSDLPTTDNRRRGPDIVNLTGEQPAETQVFTSTVLGKPIFVHIYTRVRQEGARTLQASACNVMIVGVSRRAFADTMFSQSESRSAFMRIPFVRSVQNGRTFVAMSSDIDPDHPSAQFGSFVMLSFEGPEEGEA